MTRLVICLFISLSGLTAHAQRFHALLVADTRASDVGPGCRKDVAVMTNLLRTIAKGLNYPLNLSVVGDSAFSPKAVRERLDTLQVGPQDIIFLYYTGHGHNLAGRTDRFPILTMKRVSDPALRSLHDALRAKKARLTITLADACNTVLPAGTRGLTPNPILKGGTVEDDVNRVLASLFLEQTGDVLIAACQPHQSACMLSDQGSYYTRSWEQALTVLTTTRYRLTWADLLRDTQSRVDRLARPDSSRQTSIYEINLRPTKPLPGTDGQFTAVSQYLNTLADERLSYAERTVQQRRATQFFGTDARVTVYQNETSVGDYALNDVLKRLTLNAGKIEQINFIEKRSALMPDGKRYQTVAIQEVWNE